MSKETAERSELMDRFEIREIIESWIIYKDTGDFENFRNLWHDDGRMVFTWFQGHVDEFIEFSKAGWEQGIFILHNLGGTAIQVEGDRAIAQTRNGSVLRLELEGVEVDRTGVGRYYDFFERRDGRWGLVLRQPIYEYDRIDSVDPSIKLQLDNELLASFPPGCRHLAYVQTKAGYTVSTDVPGTQGPAVERLYEQGKIWLSGGEIDR